MLIMPSTDIDFQALATNISTEFFRDGVSLNDGVVKVAQEMSLTPEEVRRLVEKTNTAASLHLLKTAENRKDTFVLAKTSEVLQSTHPVVDNAPAEKTASVYRGLPRKPVEAPQVKVAAADTSCDTQTVCQKGDSTRAIFALRKALDEKKLQKTALECKVQDKIDWLASEFNTFSGGPAFGKFAGECREAFGGLCEPVLSGLARYLHIDEQALEKEAAGRYVDDTTDHMQAMRTICSGLSEPDMTLM